MIYISDILYINLSTFVFILYRFMLDDKTTHNLLINTA